MKETIQTTGDEVAIVIYDSPFPPKYFRLTKRFIRILFVSVPLFLASITIALFLWGLGERVKDTTNLSLPSVDIQGMSKVQQLENEIRTLEISNKKLSDKLSEGSLATNAQDPYLMAIRKPYGMQNFVSQNRVSLDQFELVQTPGKLSLKFQIISSSAETKVTGHVIVFMVSDAGLLAWPREANASMSSGVKYSVGEPFAVSRLRPTNAEFIDKSLEGTVKFVVYIFSREGDLLLMKETESFKVGSK